MEIKKNRTEGFDLVDKVILRLDGIEFTIKKNIEGGILIKKVDHREDVYNDDTISISLVMRNEISVK